MNIHFSQEDDFLTLTAELNMGIVQMSFLIGNADMFTAEEYTDFANGKKDHLLFNDRNGYTGIRRNGKMIIFELGDMENSSSFSILEEQASSKLKNLGSERSKYDVK